MADYKAGIADPAIAESVHEIAPDLMSFACVQLQKVHPRDDYRELLELVILFLGGVPEHGVHIRKPGAMHRARWMVRLIYCLKIYLFREAGFYMKADERRGVAEMCIFGIQIYIKFWFLSPLPAMAPSNDLQLLKMLVSLDSKAAKGVLKKLSGQLWYLSEELVTLSFFNRNLDTAEKRLMVKALEREAPEDPPKRITIDAATIQNKELHHFITKNSRNFFCILSLPDSFLQVDPEEWMTNADYLAAEEIVHGLRVVNDTAERGVALIQEYNRSLTINEEQMQFALQVISEHRRLYPDTAKSTIVKGLKKSSANSFATN